MNNKQDLLNILSMNSEVFCSLGMDHDKKLFNIETNYFVASQLLATVLHRIAIIGTYCGRIAIIGNSRDRIAIKFSKKCHYVAIIR